jgi:hypothetical protein
VLIAPQRERGGHRRRRQARDRQPQVAVRQRLGEQHVGDVRAFDGGAAQLLGHAGRGKAQRGGGRQQLARGLAAPVGLGRRRAQPPSGELAGGPLQQALVVGRGQVEQLAARCRGWAHRPCQPLGDLEPQAGRQRGRVVAIQLTHR